MKHQVKKQNLGLTTVWIISIIVVLLVLIVGGVYLLSKASTSDKESKVNEEGSVAQEKTEQDTEEFNEFIVDCGDTALAVSEEEYETITNCMTDKFKECSPAKFTAAGIYHYEIIGPIDNLCKVKSKFLKNINPNWVGKEMICQYDNTKDFGTAVQNMNKCEGPLYDLMITTSIEAENGDEFHPLAIERPEEGSGYEWKTNYDSSYVQFIGENKDFKSTTHIIYEFLALKSGKTRIEFSLQSKTGEEIKKQIVKVTIR